MLAAGTLANTIGYGAYNTAGVLYFTRGLHLPIIQVGFGLSVAGFVGLAVGIPVGHLADRKGPRGIYALTMAGGAATMAGFAVTRSFWAFLLVSCIGTAAQAGGPAARGPLVRHHGGKRPHEFRAYLRSVSNLGMFVGALLAGIAIEVNTFTAYLLVIAGNGASFIICMAFTWLLPALKPAGPASGPRWIALRDFPYISLTAIDCLLSIQIYMLTVAIPLWIIQDTTAPRWLISGMMMINTAIIIVLQVPVSKRVGTLRAGGTALRSGGFALLVSSIVISLSGHASAAAAAAFLVAAIIIQSVGELWYTAGAFELSFGLAPAHAQGQYMGVFSMGTGLAGAIGPWLLTTLCVEGGAKGWFVVGVLFAVAGVAAPYVVRWAERTRPDVMDSAVSG
jgi:MFS transporter